MLAGEPPPFVTQRSAMGTQCRTVASWLARGFANAEHCRPGNSAQRSVAVAGTQGARWVPSGAGKIAQESDARVAGGRGVRGGAQRGELRIVKNGVSASRAFGGDRFTVGRWWLGALCSDSRT